MARHLFVCTNGKGSGKPTCGPRGGDALVAAVQRLLLERGAIESPGSAGARSDAERRGVVIDALVTPCGCLGPCFDGPNAVVYPEAIWYAGLAVSDAPRLVDHLVTGSVLADRVTEPPGSRSEDERHS